MKGKEEVISEFNEYVNMTAEELETWLKSGDSNSAGWPKDDAEGDGETVGHDSGRKIVEILKKNPEKKEDKYTDEQVEHMRKVVAYCKRHLAQETKSNSEKSPEEVKETKSYASLKNWGHDFLKAQGKDGGEQNGKSSKGDEKKAESNGSKKESNGSKKAEKTDDHKEEEEEVEDEGEEKAGDKRKKSTEENGSEENGSNKKRQTRQGEGKSAKKSDENGDDEKEEEAEAEGGDEDGDEEMEDDGEEGDDKENGSGKTTKKGPKKGDTVSWNWGNGQPEGKVLDVKEEKTTIETKRGNEVSRDGNPDDPAVVLDTGKSKAIKSNHELN
ncbi:DNA-binding protein [Colletotrichum karsti]|uniref:DNA-binding protein n=1 Tax=Colletotrichum karsti TaxID=1095194 RepID=A0A9P6I749_9PEZI|nr:DNA-binding protein [Colletotrichum karsti]KAF9877115.1 DNA-binding protein [Colletotrichum karsti]